MPMRILLFLAVFTAWIPQFAFACQYCAATTDVCVATEQVCTSYNSVCDSYEDVCISYNSVCTSYSYQCSAYDDNGDCIDYTYECDSYSQECSGYQSQCTHYNQECASYGTQCTEYQTQCTSYYYGDYITVSGSVTSNETNLAIRGSSISLSDNNAGDNVTSMATDRNGAYALTLFAYDDNSGNLSVNVCTNANYLYPKTCQRIVANDSCDQPIRSYDFGRSPYYSGTSFVKGLYADVLKRSATIPDIHSWVDALQNIGPFSVANGFVNSVEYRSGLIGSFYQSVLGRNPEPAGLNFWLSQFAAGQSDEAVKAQFYGSAEYYARVGSTPTLFVQALYQAFLGRPGEPAGVNYWVSQLNSGVSRTTVAAGFLAATEYKGKLVNGWYQDYLRRGADPGGLNAWVNALATGTTDEVVQSYILSSSEYINLSAASPRPMSAMRAAARKAPVSISIKAPAPSSRRASPAKKPAPPAVRYSRTRR